MKLHMIAMLITCMLRLASGSRTRIDAAVRQPRIPFGAQTDPGYAGETLDMVRFLFSGIIQKTVMPDSSISSKGPR